MQAQSARARVPSGPSGMGGQRRNLGPSLPAIAATKERCRCDTSIKHTRFARSSWLNMPNALELEAGFFAEGWIVLCSLPRLSEIRGADNFAAKPGVIRSRIN